MTRLHYTGTRQQWLVAKRGSARHVFCEAEPRCCTTPSRDRHTCCQVPTAQPNDTHAAPPPPRTSCRDTHLANKCKPPSTLSGCTLQPLQLRSKQLHRVHTCKDQAGVLLERNSLFWFHFPAHTSLRLPSVCLGYLQACNVFLADFTRDTVVLTGSAFDSCAAVAKFVDSSVE